MAPSKVEGSVIQNCFDVELAKISLAESSSWRDFKDFDWGIEADAYATLIERFRTKKVTCAYSSLGTHTSAVDVQMYFMMAHGEEQNEYMQSTVTTKITMALQGDATRVGVVTS